MTKKRRPLGSRSDRRQRKGTDKDKEDRETHHFFIFVCSVALLVRLMLMYSTESTKVCDLTAGSLTTGVAGM
mgnify:CR=1 FL=1